MEKPALNFGGSISQNYEDYLGLFIFEPYANDLASRPDMDGVTKVLELACGSGRLTRHLAELLPEQAILIATDIANDMIDVAKKSVNSNRIQWLQADMLQQPFEANTFDLVVCQFGIMLVPGHEKALTEIFRVLKPGGKVFFNVWTDIQYNRIWSIADDVINSYLGKRLLQANPGPFALGDQEMVRALLVRAGFAQVRSATVELIGETNSATMAAHGFIYGLPLVLAMQKERPELLNEIVKSLAMRLAADLGNYPLRVPQRAIVFEALK